MTKDFMKVKAVGISEVLCFYSGFPLNEKSLLHLPMTNAGDRFIK